MDGVDVSKIAIESSSNTTMDATSNSIRNSSSSSADNDNHSNNNSNHDESSSSTPKKRFSLSGHHKDPNASSPIVQAETPMTNVEYSDAVIRSLVGAAEVLTCLGDDVLEELLDEIVQASH